ncbi:MAG TPA: CoA-binding protein [Pyrinomonadaceae bacterium]
MEINSPKGIKRILNEYKTIVVVGLSSNTWRASNSVSAYMQSKGYRIIPVNPNETQVLDEKAYATLAEVPQQVELVNVFRRSEEAGAVVDEAIRAGAKAVWLQEGVIDPAAAKRALDAGLLVVMDRCILKEHARMQRALRSAESDDE